MVRRKLLNMAIMDFQLNKVEIQKLNENSMNQQLTLLDD